MAQGRSRRYDDGRLVEVGAVTAAALTASGSTLKSIREARREIDTLRSINLHLEHQVTLLKEREAHAQRLADRDGLTGLHNRRKMVEMLEAAIDVAAQREQRLGLLFIDLDGFKPINDQYGHATGDKLLTMVASRISGRARSADFVCRYGGDEFVVILPKVANMAAVARVADRIAKRVALPYRADGAELRVTAAIGMAMFPDAACNAADLLRAADESMYRAKSQGADLVPSRQMAPARSWQNSFKGRIALSP